MVEFDRDCGGIDWHKAVPVRTPDGWAIEGPCVDAPNERARTVAMIYPTAADARQAIRERIAA